MFTREFLSDQTNSWYDWVLSEGVFSDDKSLLPLLSFLLNICEGGSCEVWSAARRVACHKETLSLSSV
jgi:hypothetical protein